MSNYINNQSSVPAGAARDNVGTIIGTKTSNSSAPVDLGKKGGQDPSNLQAYDELKKRLLSEYKKLTSGKKSFDEQVREKYKNLKQRTVSGTKKQSTQIPP
jgi:hypothetical protein